MLFLILQFAIQCQLFCKKYRSVLDANDDYNTKQMVTSSQDTCESIKESIRTLW